MMKLLGNSWKKRQATQVLVLWRHMYVVSGPVVSNTFFGHDMWRHRTFYVSPEFYAKVIFWLCVLTSVPQKNVPSAVVIYYYAWYVFLRDWRYLALSWVISLLSITCYLLSNIIASQIIFTTISFFFCKVSVHFKWRNSCFSKNCWVCSQPPSLPAQMLTQKETLKEILHALEQK